jgi:hypothetical protein
MKIQLASQAAPGRADNEDLAFAAGGLVGVLDGVTAPPGVDPGCVHGPAWYVRRLSSHLQRTAASPGTSLVEALAEAIHAVRGDHEGRCDLDHPNTPAATLAVARATEAHVEYLVLSDAHLLLDTGDQVQVITDQRYAAAVADIRQAALTGATAIGTTDHDALLRQVALRRQQRINRPGGYWIAAATPEAAHEATTGQQPLTGPHRIRRAALLTDGASCAVEKFSLFDWRGLLDLVTQHGPHELIRQVRAAENADQTGRTRPRYKRHDDATVLLCQFES